MTRAVGGLWWGYQDPSCFVLAEVLSSRAIHVLADLKLVNVSVPEAARRIKALADQYGVKLGATFADASMAGKKSDREGLNTPSVATTFRANGIAITPVYGDVAHGWQRLHDFMREGPAHEPWMTVSENCRTLIRTIPTIVRKKNDPDDCEGETYAAHALRALVSGQAAPWHESAVKPKPKYGTLGYYKSLGKPSRGVLLLASRPSGAVRRYGR